MEKVAILIDGGYFLKRLPAVRPDVRAADADAVASSIRELVRNHLQQLSKIYEVSKPFRLLYRTFYYDARPYDKKGHTPVGGNAKDYAKSDEARFRAKLFDALHGFPNLAVRLGDVRKDGDRSWILKEEPQQALLKGKIAVEDLTDRDFVPALRQKGVDMRIGIDIASIALKRQASIIILISGDADFIPAAKLARREGIQFILDPLWREIPRDLSEHIDGLRSGFPRPQRADTGVPGFKGNDGNLMQHWVLCELTDMARKHTSELTYIDAHSMAPIATNRSVKENPKTGRFDKVFGRLSGGGSIYEKAWKALAPEAGTYPNSANFIAHIWQPAGFTSMLLCENDEKTASFLRSWSEKVRAVHDNFDIEVAHDDWRQRFARGLPEQKGLVFISFDPYMINRHQRKKNPGNIYPDDIDLLVEKTRSYSKNILLQLSTYDTNDDNPQDKVEACVRQKLEAAGFEKAAAIVCNKKMMSFVYHRGVDFSKELASLSRRFDSWFNAR